MLYSDISIRLYINEYIEKRISILYRIRQRDPLSYILFILIIEGLIRQLRDVSIRDAAIDRQIIKLLIYTNNTVIILRTQEDIDIIIKILNLYCRAIEVRVNRLKSLLMRIENVSEIRILDVRDISLRKVYKYLRISIKIYIKRSIKEFQKSILSKIKSIVNI